jgi:hypothetical protein
VLHLYRFSTDFVPHTYSEYMHIGIVLRFCTYLDDDVVSHQWVLKLICLKYNNNNK